MANRQIQIMFKILTPDQIDKLLEANEIEDSIPKTMEQFARNNAALIDMRNFVLLHGPDPSIYAFSYFFLEVLTNAAMNARNAMTSDDFEEGEFEIIFEPDFDD